MLLWPSRQQWLWNSFWGNFRLHFLNALCLLLFNQTYNEIWFSLSQRTELQHKFYILIDTELHIFSEVMKKIQCAHPPYQHNGFVATCQLWTASGGVHALLVLETTESSSSTRQGAYVFIIIYTYKPFAATAT